MLDAQNNPHDDTEEFFERLLWDATREYEDELRAVDHPKTRALHRQRKPAPRALVLSTTRITPRPTTPSATTPSATTPSANWSADTPLTLAEKQLKYSAHRALGQQNAQSQAIIKPTMKTEITVQSAYFSNITKDIK